MNFRVSEEAGRARADHLLRCVAAFTQKNRGVPSLILTELCRLQPFWKNRDDVPAVVVDASTRFGRFATKRRRA